MDFFWHSLGRLLFLRDSFPFCAFPLCAQTQPSVRPSRPISYDGSPTIMQGGPGRRACPSRQPRTCGFVMLQRKQVSAFTVRQAVRHVRDVRAETRQNNRADENGSGFASGPFQFRFEPAVHAGFEKVVAELCNAGNVSRQLEELTTCKPGGSDSPKVRTACARSGGTYFERTWMVSSAIPSTINREIVCSRIASLMSRERSLVRRAIGTRVESVTAVSVDKSSRAFSQSPAISGSTTECCGPYRGMRAPI